MSKVKGIDVDSNLESNTILYAGTSINQRRTYGWNDLLKESMTADPDYVFVTTDAFKRWLAGESTSYDFTLGKTETNTKRARQMLIWRTV